MFKAESRLTTTDCAAPRTVPRRKVMPKKLKTLERNEGKAPLLVPTP